jgi:type IV pilus assembly protein PilB
MNQKRVLLGDYLLTKKIISQEQLDEAIQEQKKTHQKIGAILIAMGYVSEKDIAQALSEQLDFPFIDLSTYEVDPDALQFIPDNIARKLEVIPVFSVGDSLSIAMTNPLDVGAIDEIERLTNGLRVKPLIGTKKDIMAAIEKHYSGGGTVSPATAPVSTPVRPVFDEGDDEEPEALEDEARQETVIKLVNDILEEAIRVGASDIHIEPEEKQLFCRFRVDGVLKDVTPPPFQSKRAIVSRIKIMADMNIAQTRIPQDGRIETAILGRKIDLRIAMLPTIYGEHVSVRILDKSGGIIKLEELGFQPELLHKFKQAITSPHGMILVSGPTGSGKSTTLYAILNTINNLEKNIITLEDPVEYTISRVNQAQVNVQAGLTFAAGLRSIVRLDPDVIMVGEIRDKETADVSIQAALTGHLVFSTIHTNDAPSAAARLIDIGVEPYLVSSSLIGVLAQRLIRKLCVKCREVHIPGEKEIEAISKATEGDLRTTSFYKPVGCPECNNTGYKGRTSIFEFMVPDNEIKELMVHKAPAHEIKNSARRQGMKTLQEDGLMKASFGITSLSEVLRVSQEK